MIELGYYNTLKVVRSQDQDLILSDEGEQEVVLPSHYVSEGLSIGDQVEVFVYKDHDKRLVATTQKTKITIGKFAYLEVVAVTQHGAFLDWGLDKDLFVPFKEQPQPMQRGESYMVYLYLDTQSDRLAGSARIHNFLNNENLGLIPGEEVEVLMWGYTDLGVNVIVNQQHKGLIYQNELFAQIQLGETRKGYVAMIREDNKLDIRLQQDGYQRISPSADLILTRIKEKDGFLPLTDKSPPELIAQEFEMSKKTFKKAVGALYKQRLIRLTPEGIWLVGSERGE